MVDLRDCDRPSLAEQLREPRQGFIVTGANGWLGRFTLEILSLGLGDDFARRVTAFGTHVGEVGLRNGITVPVRSMDEALSAPVNPDFGSNVLLHYAFQTRDKVGAMNLAQYVAANQRITRQVVAAIPAWRIDAFFLPSSGAVYAEDRSLSTDIERNPYGALKVQDERQFTALCRQQRIRLFLPRIFTLAGPYINKFDSYALASLISQALAGHMALRADGPVYRSYLYIGDLLEIGLRWLLASRAAETLVLDAAGGEVVEMGELALRVQETLGMPAARVERPPLTATANRYVGDPAILEELASQLGISLMPLRTQIAITAAYIAAVAPGGRPATAPLTKTFCGNNKQQE